MLSFILLMIVFRSIVVPIKALILNLLSVAAAYGVVVAVSQKGSGAGVLGFRQVEVLESWLPLVPVLDPVRPLDGLPRVPAVADP